MIQMRYTAWTARPRDLARAIAARANACEDANTTLRCAECGREQPEGERGWRSFVVAAEEREFDGPGGRRRFLPRLAGAELGLGASRNEP
jgi:hypothetical protein